MIEKGEKKRRTWDVGNTTIRNPYRIESGLKIIAEAIEGKTWTDAYTLQTAVHEALKTADIIKSISGTEKDSSGRKWLSGPKQLGLLRADYKSQHPSVQLTDAGKALIAQAMPATDIFLRQLIKYQLPNYQENNATLREDFAIHPLWYFTKLLYQLQFESEEPLGLNKQEISLFVVTCIQYEAQHERLHELLLRFRRERSEAKGSVAKTRVANEYLARIKDEFGIKVKDDTFWDYADSNLRYLSRTGLFSLRGDRVWIDDTKKALAEFVIQNARQIAEHLTPEQFEDPSFPSLPSEKADYLSASIEYLKGIAVQEQLSLDIPETTSIGTAQLRRVEESLEEQIKAQREERFAKEQEQQVADICDTFEKIIRKEFLGGNVYQPAFYEWNIWRGFLAMGGFVNHVSATRRFQIDSAMYPLHHAKGGYSDMLFEYPEMAIAVEATLSSGENQWSMEAEPVTRHVKQEMMRTPKKTLGVFIAPNISLNTYQNFLECKLYLHEDADMPARIDIVPLTHGQFSALLRTHPDLKSTEHLFLTILDSRTNSDAKRWKQMIEKALPTGENSKQASLF